MPHRFPTLIAVAFLLLASPLLTARNAEALVFGAFETHRLQAQVLEEAGFKKHGFKRHGFKRHGFRGHRFRGHGFGRHGFRGGRHFGGKRFFGRNRFFGGRRHFGGARGFGHKQFGRNDGFFHDGGKRGAVGAFSAGTVAPQRDATGGQLYPTKPLDAHETEGYEKSEQAANSVTLSPGGPTPPSNEQRTAGGLAAGPTPIPEDCQRVSKASRDESGRSVRIGGTLCFDQSGQGFIVEGSRFIMDRL